MSNDLIELLDRQYAFLNQQQGVAYLRQIRRWYITLRQDVRLASLIGDLLEEAIGLIKARLKHDDEAIRELVLVRNELIKRAPKFDDSAMPQPRDAWPTDPWHRSFALFDRIANAGDSPRYLEIDLNGLDDKLRAEQLIRILRGKLEQIDQPPEETDQREATEGAKIATDDLAKRINHIEAQQEYQQREFANDKLTSGGIALLKVRGYIDDINPAPKADVPLIDKLNEAMHAVLTLRYPLI